METFKAILQDHFINWSPPVITRCLRSLKRRFSEQTTDNAIVFAGNYESWEEASNASIGYDSDIILKKVLDATLKVKNGQAAFERDSVTFNELEYSWPLLTTLFFAAARNNGVLNVVDFGGSLGSSYFQSRVFLDKLSGVRWSVVEQPQFVFTGREQVADERLRFFDTAGEALCNSTPQVLLLSGVLQCVPDPYATLKELFQYSWNQVIVDRVPFLVGRAADRLTVQTVPSWIYSASYPSWFFAKDKFLRFFAEDFDALCSWQCDEYHSPSGESTRYEGFCFTRKSRSE